MTDAPKYPKYHRASAFGVQDQTHFKFNSYHTRLEPNVPFKAIFDPIFWVHARERLKKGDIIRVQAYDDSFDVWVTVGRVLDGGIEMSLMPRMPVADPQGAAEGVHIGELTERCVPLDAEGNPVPRVQFTPVTKWRVIGLDNKEVVRDLETEAEAVERLGQYLADLHLRYPTIEESDAAREAGEAAAAKLAAATGAAKAARPTKPAKTASPS